MLRSKIDTEAAIKSKRYKSRPCDFANCGKMTTGRRWCRTHAAIVKAQQQAECVARTRSANRKTKTSSRATGIRMDEAVRARLRLLPPVAKASDILRMDADKAARIITDILNGKCTWAGGASAAVSRPDKDSD